MTDKQPDAAETFNKLITEWERGFDAMANKIMGTDEFSSSMNKFQDLQLSMQKRFNEAMAEQLTTFNLPSRDDMLRLGEGIRSLDKRLSHIEDLLASQAKKSGKSKKDSKNKKKGPPRTKQPPSRQGGQQDG